MQIKTIMRYCLTAIRMATIKKKKSVDRVWRNWSTCALLVGMENGAVTMENSIVALKKS